MRKAIYAGLMMIMMMQLVFAAFPDSYECDSQYAIRQADASYLCDNVDATPTYVEPASNPSGAPGTFDSDGTIDYREHCDSTNLVGRSCTSRKGPGWIGELKCNADFTFDESGCYRPFHPTVGQVCGNYVVEGTEECDEGPAGDSTCTDACMLGDTNVDYCETTFPRNSIEACNCATPDEPTGIKYITQAIYQNTEDVNGAVAGVQTDGCCGDESGEFIIQMNTFAIRDETDWLLRSYPDVYACCDDDTDCVYKGVCYNEGEVIAPNPRYFCGPNRNLREAVDFNYDTYATGLDAVIKGATVPPYTNENYQFQTQRTPFSYNDYISCNSINGNLPQLWTNISACKGTPAVPGGPGRLTINVVDGPTGNPIPGTDVTIRMELYRNGIADDIAFQDNRVYTTVYEETSSPQGQVTISPLLGTYYTVVVETEDGGFGVFSPLRINYDAETTETIEVYRDNACFGCVDYANNGFCSSSCEGISIYPDAPVSDICSFTNSEFPPGSIAAACDNHVPGGKPAEVLDNNGVLRQVDCCSTANAEDWDIGNVIAPLSAKITCPTGDHLVVKEYIISSGSSQMKMKISVCE